MGYRLRTRIVVTGYESNRNIEFDSTGDLVGSGSFVFSAVGRTTVIDIRWNVTPTKPWMRFAKPLFGRLFTANHDALMEQGEAGLVRFVTNFESD